MLTFRSWTLGSSNLPGLDNYTPCHSPHDSVSIAKFWGGHNTTGNGFLWSQKQRPLPLFPKAQYVVDAPRFWDIGFAFGSKPRSVGQMSDPHPDCSLSDCTTAIAQVSPLPPHIVEARVSGNATLPKRNASINGQPLWTTLPPGCDLDT